MGNAAAFLEGAVNLTFNRVTGDSSYSAEVRPVARGTVLLVFGSFGRKQYLFDNRKLTGMTVPIQKGDISF